eukprot:scaffold5748_cov124-Isochrysis_galbana.AAC.7
MSRRLAIRSYIESVPSASRLNKGLNKGVVRGWFYLLVFGGVWRRSVHGLCACIRCRHGPSDASRCSLVAVRRVILHTAFSALGRVISTAGRLAKESASAGRKHTDCPP